MAGCTTVACEKEIEISYEMNAYDLMAEHDNSVLIILKANKAYPVSLSVEPGTVVSWKNTDGVVHKIAAYDGSFLSKDLYPGDVFSYTFIQPGTYAYYSVEHKGLQGTITVK